MKNTLKIITLLLFISCSNYGEKVTYNGTDIYYKEGVTKAQVKKLGTYLVKNEFADGIEKSVQLIKNDSTKNLTFRMVVSPGTEEGKDMIFKLFAKQLSEEVFEGKPVDFQLCDNTFETIKTFSYQDLDKMLSVEATDITYTKNVSEREAQQLADFLKESKFTDGTPKTIQLDKNEGAYIFRMVVAEGAETVEANVQLLKEYGLEISKNAFLGVPVIVHMCDAELNTLLVIK